MYNDHYDNHDIKRYQFINGGFIMKLALNAMIFSDTN